MTSTHTYLVTGGLGFLGAPLARALAQQGHGVRVLDDASRGRRDRLATVPGVEVVQGDVRRLDEVRRAARGVDGVLHFAFINGTRHFYERPAEVLEVGVKGMLNVLDAAMAEGAGELLLASSSEVYQTPPHVPTAEDAPLLIPDPHNPRYSYAGGKVISELLALNYGRDRLDRVLIVRPHNVYGPDMGWEHVIPQFAARLAQLKASGSREPAPFPIQGSGTQTRAFIFVDDFVQGTLRVLARGEHLGIYHVGTMDEVAIADLAHRVAAAVGVRVQVRPGPEAPGATPRRCPDTRKLQALGFQPAYTLDQGLKPTAAWYAAHASEAPPGVLDPVHGGMR